MRSYGQYCAVAKSLDVLGDRWTLLIVRELLLAGPSRYTDLRNGLPGIATNLLSDRLKELEAAGVIVRELAPPPIATTVFRLTPRGEQLGPVLHQLGLWGIPYMAEGPAPEDEFRGRWLAWPAELFLVDSRPEDPPVALELRSAGDSTVVETGEGEIKTHRGPHDQPDAVLDGPPQAILAFLSGHLQLKGALERGMTIEGDASVLDRLIPIDAPVVEVQRA
jgi:DNA-binding HxlR family transcriptional regulator